MSARIALLAALLAACHVPVAQAVGGVLAVALSISKPGQYRFVAPVETNRLSGVGMGSSAPSGDAPLAYTDAAFLAEAFAERASVFDADSGGVTNGAPKVTKTPSISSIKNRYADVFRATSVSSWYSGYADPTAQMTDSIREVSRELSWVDARECWQDIFGTTAPFLSRSLTPDAFGYGAPLKSETVCTLYDDLGRLTRPCTIVMLKPSSGRCGQEVTVESTYSGWTSGYDGIDGKWRFGEDRSTNYVDVSETAYYKRLSRSLHLRAGKEKARGFKWVKDEQGNGEMRDVTGVKDFQYTELKRYNFYGGGLVFADLRPGFAKLSGRTFRGVKAFGVGYWSIRQGIGMTTTRSETRCFVVEIPVRASVLEDTPFLLPLEIGNEDCDAPLASQVTELFGDPGYETAKELLDTLAEPDVPGSEYETYAPTYSDGWYSRSIYIEHFFVVFDMEFAARTLDQ